MSTDAGAPIYIRVAADGARWDGFTAVDGRAEALGQAHQAKLGDGGNL